MGEEPHPKLRIESSTHEDIYDPSQGHEEAAIDGDFKNKKRSRATAEDMVEPIREIRTAKRILDRIRSGSFPIAESYNLPVKPTTSSSVVLQPSLLISLPKKKNSSEKKLNKL